MLRVHLKVQPGASKKEIRYYSGKRIKVYVNAPPENGRANNELIEFLSGELAVPKKAVTIEKGKSTRDKILNIKGIDAARFRQIIK
ncbi:MAG: DUF167 domain-containing protein [Elusimicrobiota bacterium]|nr:DUF167 domain-containing protein [Elusimicrobiota bacterium]